MNSACFGRCNYLPCYTTCIYSIIRYCFLCLFIKLLIFILGRVSGGKYSSALKSQAVPAQSLANWIKWLQTWFVAISVYMLVFVRMHAFRVFVFVCRIGNWEHSMCVCVGLRRYVRSEWSTDWAKRCLVQLMHKILN